mgnify:CR=1 FL=1
MTCTEWEQLLDAYLDGQLAGSLRLEFDAHRLRCRRCQQSLAMLETVGHVLGSDSGVPSLSPGFTDRVMRDIAEPPQRSTTIPWTRVALVGLALAQAAAILAFALLWNAPRVTPAPLRGVADNAAVEDDVGFRAVQRLIAEGVEDNLWEMHHARVQLTQDLIALAKYLDITLPEEVARESSKMAQVNPWNYLWSPVAPGEDEAVETPATEEDVHSI